ncbi:MAG: conjugal transfer protein TraF [Nitrospiraceae bacterium]
MTFRVFLGLIGLYFMLLPVRASAVEFVIVGPRAVGMGGAGVAVTSDALATYWNPAGLAMTRTMDIRIQGSTQTVDRLGLFETVNEINDLNLNDTSAANQARLQSLIDKINRPGATGSAMGAAGVYMKTTLGDHAFGFNVSDVATGGAFVPTPVGFTQNGGTLNVTGQLALRGLEARQAGFSYAYSFADRTFAIGATAKIIQGAAYASLTNIAGGNDNIDVVGNLGKAKISTAFGIDLGAIYRPSSWLRFGVVAKDINEPAFDAPGGGEFKLTPQVRGGMAVNPYSSLTITFDGDISSNRTLVPGLKSRVLSLGAEQTLFLEVLSLRVGALKNVEDAASAITPTAGIGLKLFALRIDVGGGYDFRERGALASGSVAVTF